MARRSRLFGILIAPALALILAGCVTPAAVPKKQAKITGSYVLLTSAEGRKRINRSAYRDDPQRAAPQAAGRSDVQTLRLLHPGELFQRTGQDDH